VGEAHSGGGGGSSLAIGMREATGTARTLTLKSWLPCYVRVRVVAWSSAISRLTEYSTVSYSAAQQRRAPCGAYSYTC